jgi:hypothetical protein
LVRRLRGTIRTREDFREVWREKKIVFTGRAGLILLLFRGLVFWLLHVSLLFYLPAHLLVLRLVLAQFIVRCSVCMQYATSRGTDKAASHHT